MGGLSKKMPTTWINTGGGAMKTDRILAHHPILERKKQRVRRSRKAPRGVLKGGEKQFQKKRHNPLD